MKTVDTVREGGIVAFITSQGVLNAEQGRPVREWLMKRCDVVSAVRFPNNLFIDHAGIEVGSDLIIWQKKAAAGELTPLAAGFHRIPQAVERYSGEQPVPNVRPRDTYRRKGRHRPLRKTRDGVHARGRHRGIVSTPKLEYLPESNRHRSQRLQMPHKNPQRKILPTSAHGPRSGIGI